MEEIGAETEPITDKQFYEWLKTSKLIDRWCVYHDCAGGTENVYLIEKDGFEYKLVEFNEIVNKEFVWNYGVRQLSRCPQQEGDGI